MNDKGRREDQLTLELLETIGKNSRVSQRHLARQMGVALGLANSYLKRCIRKGYVKIKEAPANRYFYYVTPKGFAEKSRLTAKYLANSFSFYRQAVDGCREIFTRCREDGHQKIVLCGVSDLAEIALLHARELGIPVSAIYDADHDSARFMGVPVYPDLHALEADVYILTDCEQPLETYNAVKAAVDPARLRVPSVLGIAHK